MSTCDREGMNSEKSTTILSSENLTQSICQGIIKLNSDVFSTLMDGEQNGFKDF